MFGWIGDYWHWGWNQHNLVAPLLLLASLALAAFVILALLRFGLELIGLFFTGVRRGLASDEKSAPPR